MATTTFLHTLRVLSYPYVTTPKKLPKKPGLYYVVLKRKVLYVGLAGETRSNLWQRWNSYNGHKMSGFVTDERGSGRIYYRVLPRKRLRYLEALEIKRFSPPYNIARPNPSAYRSGFEIIDLIFLSMSCVLFFLLCYY